MVPVVATRDTVAPGEAAILAAGTEVFSREGFHGASIRDIAKRAGLSTASLYHHFGSKQDLLYRILSTGMDELLERTAEAVEEAGDDPEARLRAVVRVHVLVHAQRRERATMTTAEMKHLKPAQRKEMLEKFRAQQRFFTEAVVDGARAGVFRTEDPEGAAMAIGSMCTGVARWFKPNGPKSDEEIAEQYVDFAVALLRGGSDG